MANIGAVDVTQTPLEEALAAGQDAVARAEEFAEDLVAQIKPMLRGWFHAVVAPLSLVVGVLLMLTAPTVTAAWAAAAWMVTSVVLFGVSGVYHRGNWSPRKHNALMRADHANIYLAVAGSWTPYALLALEGAAQTALLAVTWAGAVAGAAFRVWWVDAPRWLYVPLAAALGLSAVAFLPQLWSGAGAAVMTLTIIGGVIYALGAVAYGLQRPNTWPTVFGFHEYFHGATALGWSAQAAAMYLLVSQAA